ncbi:Epn2 [Linum grandiflorum]
MSILSKSSSDMSAAAAGVGGGSATSFLEFKKQASFFFKEKIKTARLALTDVTPAQLLTEEATSGNPWAPDPRTLGSISRAAFELDDYLRIVEILHKRLGKFERKNWRATYHSLILLERLLTHGPESVSREFLEDRHAIRDAQTFQHIDEKGFNWGLAVRKKSERILKLLENEGLLKEERDRSRKLTRGIQGFGSFTQKTSSSSSSSSKLGILQQSYGRSNSQFNDDSEENKIVSDNKENLIQKVEGSMNKDAIFDMGKVRENRKVEMKLKENMAPDDDDDEEEVNLLVREEVAVVAAEEDHHPFTDTEHQTAASSLLSARDGILLQGY